MHGFVCMHSRPTVQQYIAILPCLGERMCESGRCAGRSPDVQSFPAVFEFEIIVWKEGRQPRTPLILA